MITEDYVSFETAKLLQKKGFKGECDYWYDSDGNLRSDIGGYICSAPTTQMAMKWLRETHYLYIQFVLNQDVEDEEPVIENYLHFNVSRLDRFANEGGDCKWYNSYEEACEAAIKYCLENLI